MCDQFITIVCIKCTICITEQSKSPVCIVVILYWSGALRGSPKKHSVEIAHDLFKLNEFSVTFIAGMNVLFRVAQKYNQAVKQFPFVTNAVTGFFISAVGDVYCQKYFDKKKVTDNGKPAETPTWNARRSFEMGLVRAFVITPFIHFWYPFLERVSPGATLFRVFGRVFVDQLIGSPTVIIMVFMATSAMRGELSSILVRIRQQFLGTWFTGLKYWPIVHSINFSVVPLMHRSLFAHFASVYWMAVLSYYSNAKIVSTEDLEKN